jgi:hypothetical protein
MRGQARITEVGLLGEDEDRTALWSTSPLVEARGTPVCTFSPGVEAEGETGGWAGTKPRNHIVVRLVCTHSLQQPQGPLCLLLVPSLTTVRVRWVSTEGEGARRWPPVALQRHHLESPQSGQAEGFGRPLQRPYHHPPRP